MPLKLAQNLPNGGIPVLSLKEYLSQDRTLVIPPWQREYSWKITADYQVDTLMKDLLGFLQDPKREEYLMGSVVLCELPGDEKRPLLIDGQQRTLTLTLLLMCCQKFLLSAGILNNANVADAQIVSDIQSCITVNAYKILESRVEMKRADAEDTLKSLYAWSIVPGDFDQSVFKNMDKKNETQKNLILATEFIYKEMVGSQKLKKDGTTTGKAGNWLTATELKKVIYDLLHKVKFIEIKVNEKRESISVFDHINNRGLALNPADLVKNLMFEEVPDDDFNEISENWEEMSSTLMATKKSRLADPRFILRSISHVEYGAHESYDKLDIFWSDKFKKNRADSKDGISAKAFSKQLLDYSEHLKALVLRDPNYRYPLSDIFLSSELGSVQHYSVLLAGIHFNNRETFLHLCRQINYRTLLYMFAGEKTQVFDALIPKWAHAIRSLSPSASKQDLNKVYNDFAKPDLPLFSSLKENVASWDYTNSGDKKKIRAVLALLSVELNAYCNDPVTIEDAMRTTRRTNRNAPWQIEHVYPQSKGKDSVYQNIGNLVLLNQAANHNASDDDPKDKRDHYAQSPLILTKTLAGSKLVNSNHENKVVKLLATLQVDTKKWDLASWDAKAVKFRTDFYVSYFSYLIRGVAD